MNDLIVGLLVSVCVFLGGMIGMLLYRLLPAGHQSEETRDHIRLVIGMISVLASLVLGLLTASAKQTFDRADQDLRGFAADIMILSQTLHAYGPETAEARAMLRAYTERAVATTWSDEATRSPASLEDPVAGQQLEAVLHLVVTLKPVTEDQHMFRAEAITLANRLLRARWTLLVNQSGALSPVLLSIMVVWVAMIFVSFGLFAPRNATVLIAFFICSLSIGTSIFLIRDMNNPFRGLITVSGKAMQRAAEHLAP